MVCSLYAGLEHFFQRLDTGKDGTTQLSRPKSATVSRYGTERPDSGDRKSGISPAPKAILNERIGGHGCRTSTVQYDETSKVTRVLDRLRSRRRPATIAATGCSGQL